MIWEAGYSPIRDSDDAEGFLISFEMEPHATLPKALKALTKVVASGKIEWLFEDKEGWKLNLDRCFKQLSELRPHPWLKGTVTPLIEVETHQHPIFDDVRPTTTLRIWVSEKEIQLSQPQRIFLSHKGIDKPLVRQYFSVLQTIGFDVWLDEDAMVAGVSLERALLSGMRSSCAAVFFLTPNYVDENYLATEIDYAMAQKRQRGDQFSIITLLLAEESGRLPQIPDLLKQFVWKQPKNPLQALEEILRALPIAVRQIAPRQI